MGWHLAGYQLEHGNVRPPPPVSPEGGDLARQRSRSAADRFGVRRVDAKTLAGWRSEAAERTLYVLDVRTIEEFEAGHIAGSRHAPGGQLVQSTDSYMGTHRARVVLVDPEFVRAEMSASWLRQLGWEEVYVLDSGFDGQTLEEGARTPVLLGDLPAVDLVSPVEAKRNVDAGACFVDLTRSLDHRDNHPEGAQWGKRETLESDLKAIACSEAVLTAADHRLAVMAAGDLAESGIRCTVIDGGSRAWEMAGFPMAAGMGAPLAALDDVFMRPYDKDAGKAEMERRMNAYLSWEVGLVEQIGRAGGISFQSYRS